MTGRSDQFETEVRPVNGDGLDRAAELIRAGQPVAVATETVYGLAADATRGEAVARIYAAKGRPSFNPLIVHVPSLEVAERIALFDDLARDLAKRFWPGPLTLVLPRHPDTPVAALATAGLSTVAIRLPAHLAMQSLLEAVGRPLAAPSANASGRISPTRAEHVLASLSGRIPMILDSGPTEHGVESTIVGVTDGQARLLRPGPIDPVALGVPLAGSSGTIEAPGQMKSHYAPRKPLRLNAAAGDPDEWLIGFGAIAGNSTLSTSGNLVEAAARLFEQLHEAEMKPQPRIAVAPIPFQGLGLAINDRLSRAAAPVES